MSQVDEGAVMSLEEFVQFCKDEWKKISQPSPEKVSEFDLHSFVIYLLYSEILSTCEAFILLDREYPGEASLSVITRLFFEQLVSLEYILQDSDPPKRIGDLQLTSINRKIRQVKEVMEHDVFKGEKASLQIRVTDFERDKAKIQKRGCKDRDLKCRANKAFGDDMLYEILYSHLSNDAHVCIESIQLRWIPDGHGSSALGKRSASKQQEYETIEALLPEVSRKVFDFFGVDFSSQE